MNQDKDSRLTLPIILTITLIFIGIATLFYVRYQDKVKIVKQEKLLREIKKAKKNVKVDYSDFLEKYKCPEGQKCGGS